MASVVRYPRSKYWFAAFRDAQGIQHRRTTRETNKLRALRVAEQFESAAQRKLSAARVRATFAEFYRAHYKEDLPHVSVRDYAQRWLASRKTETSPLSQNLYRVALEKLLVFLGSRADASLDEITRAEIAAFRDAQLAVSSSATTNSALKVAKMIFKAARRDELIIHDPAEGVKAAKTQATFERRAFTLDELRAILALADDEWRSLVKFGLYTGQRLGDLALLTWNQIDLERDEIRLVTRKTGKRLVVPIAPALREHISTILSRYGALDDARAPLHPRSFEIVEAMQGRVSVLSKQFADLLVSAGLRRELESLGRTGGRSGKRAGQELSFHSLRHTSVSLLKDAGVPDAVVMALVGHDSAAMSQHYTHVGRDALARAAQSLPLL